jgi:putative heme iron utilization protein
MMISTAPSQEITDKFTAVPGLENVIRPSIVDKARTITHVCTSGTLCTLSADPFLPNAPFGSYVDYVIDQNGWPILLLSEQSLHSQNIRENPSVSLFAQLPRSQSGQTTAALSRVTILGSIQDVPAEELSTVKYSFTLIHTYADQIADSPKFKFCKIKPQKIYFSGGFGVAATWVDVTEYELAKPDVLAQEVSTMLAKLNSDKKNELSLLAKHFLGFDPTAVDDVRVQAVDHLGVDLRVKTAGDSPLTDEYRIGFRHSVSSAEDAKSELVKLFQECWEREQGYFFTEALPNVTKYAEDILRAKK